MSKTNGNHQHLAWHETMELHETVAFQSNELMACKMNIAHITDPPLKALYAETIQALEQNLTELLPYYQLAPTPLLRTEGREDLTAYYATHLLILTKTFVRNLAVSITEIATPSLCETFRKQLNGAILLHSKVFAYLLARGLYPAYDLNQLLANDQKNAAKALRM